MEFLRRIFGRKNKVVEQVMSGDKATIESLEKENWASLPSILLFMEKEGSELDIIKDFSKITDLRNRHYSLLSALKPSVFIPLGETLFHESKEVSGSAGFFLRRFVLDGEEMPEDVISNLGKATSLQNQNTSSEACTVLQKLIENKQDITPAMDGLTTSLASVQNKDQLIKIINLIGALGDAATPVRPHLLPLLESLDTDINNATEKALIQIAGQEPEEALVGKNILNLEQWDTSPSPKRINIGNNLEMFSWNTPLSYGSREPMIVDAMSNLIYCGKSPYRFDLDGNPKGKLQIGNGGLAVTEDGEVLVCDKSWLYRVDSNGNVLSALKTGWFQSLDFLSNEIIVGVIGQSEKTLLGFIENNQVHRVDVSGKIFYGRDVQSSSDGHLYMVGSQGSKSFWANTVFKLDPEGRIINLTAMFTNIGAICPTQLGGVDVIEMDGNRLVRLSATLKVVYDSETDTRPEAKDLFQPEYLDYVSGMDVDKNSNCYILNRGQIRKLPQFWDEPMETKESPILTEEEEVSQLLAELISIGRHIGYLTTTSEGGDAFDERNRNIRAREIGIRLNDIGGYELMRKIAYHVKEEIPSEARSLESAWGYIGKWLP